MAPTNTAAWTIAEKSIPFTVKEAPYSSPSTSEVVIKNVAVAINPIDWKLEKHAMFPLKYPTILGADICGEVVEVGKDVKNVATGDRAIAHCIVLATQEPKHGAFQEYTVAPSDLVAKVPRELEVEKAAVMPLAVSTATSGLFSEGFLELPLPQIGGRKSSGKAVLIWGASGSVGVNAVQLAAAAGVEVIATASEKNFGMVKEAGAAHVFDYHSKTIEDELADVMKGRVLYGAYDAVGSADTTKACAKALAKAKGEKFVATVLPPPEDLPDGVKAKWCQAFAIRGKPEGDHVWGKYLPQALAEQKLKCLPEAEVVGNGLEVCQKACDRNEEGVSAKKIVFTL